MPVGLIIGGLGLAANLYGQNQANKRQKQSAQQAAEMAKFRPVNTDTPFGSATFYGNKAVASLSPEYQRARNSLSGMFYNPATNLDQQAMAMAQRYAQNPTGLDNAQASQLWRDQQDLGFWRNAGMVNPMGFLSNPNDITNNQFAAQMNAIAPYQQQQQLGLENRLFKQGLLGATTGANQMRSLFDSQNNQVNSLYANALNQGLAANNQMFGQAMQAQGRALDAYGSTVNRMLPLAEQRRSLFAPERSMAFLSGARGIQGDVQQRQMQGLQGMTNLDMQALNPLQLGAQMGGAQAQAGANAGQFINNAGQTSAAMQSAFWGNLGGSMFNYGLNQGAFNGPAGGQGFNSYMGNSMGGGLYSGNNGLWNSDGSSYYDPANDFYA